MHGQHPLRVLFVSSITSGGSGKSQRSLDDALRSRGVETMMLVDNAVGATVTRFLHEQLWDASVRFERRRILGESASWLRSLPGRTPHRESGHVLVSPAPENAFPDIALSFRPDVVVGSSIARPAWRQIRETCASLGLPAVLYLREETALAHLATGDHAAVIANSKTLTAGAAEHGVQAALIPSIIDLEDSRIESTRERILLVNPRKEHGVDIIEDLAQTFRTIEFVLQESWKLTPSEQRHVDGILRRHPNVCFRKRTTSPAEVFRDAAIVLAPHQIDNRPRTILEALGNGIPVIASDLPGLVESVGSGGIIASHASDWTNAITTLWQDPVVYRDYEQRAVAFSERSEVQTDQILDSFIDLIHETLVSERDAT